MDELHYCLYKQKTDIAMLQETLLDPEFTPSILGYKFLGSGRKKGAGGVALIIKEELKYNPLNIKNYKNNSRIEMMGVEIKLRRESVKCITTYIPPTSQKEELECLYDLDLHNCIIAGDFNAHNELWSTGKSNNRGTHINNWIKTKKLTIVNSKKICTHFGRENRGSTPDLLLIGENINMTVKEIKILKNIGSDHRPISAKFKILEGNLSKKTKSIYILNSLNINNYTNKLEKIFEKCKKIINSVSYESLIGFIVYSFNQNCRTKQITNNYNGIPWWNQNITKEIKIRNKLWKLNHKKPSIVNNNNYKLQRNKVRNIIKLAKRNFWVKINIEKEINDIHKILRASNFRRKNEIEYISNNKKIEVALMVEKFSDMLCENRDYVKKSVDIDFIKKHYARIKKENITFLCKKFDFEEIQIIVNQLKTRKSPGLDNVSNFMIKNGGEVMIKYLCLIFNNIYETEIFPDAWNKGKIIPIPKNAKRRVKIEELRPISLLSSIYKIFEKAIMNRLLMCEDFMGQNSQHQYGFRKNYSSHDNLMILQSRIQSARSKGSALLVIFLDIKSAYDSVNRNILKKILKFQLGETKIYKFFKSILGKRFSKVCMNGNMSYEKELKKGVPQGAALSPLLFNLYIKSITDHNEVYSYADDLMIIYEGETTKMECLANKILIKIENNLNKIDLRLSIGKCKYMVFSRKRVNSVNIKIKEQSISRVETFNYLGVVFDSKNTFKNHIECLKLKVNKRMGQLKYITNKISGCDTKTLIRMYKSHIRPRMEYGSTIWCNAAKSSLESMESLQHKFLCWCLGISYRTARYDVRRDCNIETLEFRREIKLLKYIKNRKFGEIYKIVKPISKRKDNKKSNVFIEMKKLLNKYNLEYEELINKEWNEIYKKISKKYMINENKKETRKNNEYKQTELFIKNYRTCKKRKKKIENEKQVKRSREDEVLFNQIKFGVLQLNKFRSKFKVVNQICPHTNCNAIETRNHFLFYCEAYKQLRKKLFLSKKIKNRYLQEKFIKNTMMENKIIMFVKEALKIRKKIQTN